MIEKIIKAVKSGNKKRGRNITIGAVVGFLLSCTVVMGTDNYLWIKDDSGTIKFSIDGSTTIGKEHWLSDNPYTENTWNEATQTYINNMMLSSSEENGIDDENHRNASYGFRLSGDLSEFKFINNGSIAVAESEYCYGIENYSAIKALVNNGSITGESEYCFVIKNKSSVGILTNNGLIIGKGTRMSFGISNLGNLTNIGILTNKGVSSKVANDGRIETLINKGEITGEETADGIGIGNWGRIETLTNSGHILIMVLEFIMRRI